MNQTKITAFGGAVHNDSELKDGNETMSIEEFLNTVLGKLLQVVIFFSLGGYLVVYLSITQKELERSLSL